MKKPAFWLILWGAILAVVAAPPGRAQTAERTLKVLVDQARVHLKPEAASPVAATLAKGTVLKSAAAEGEWFRVVVEAQDRGGLVIGFIRASDVEVTREAGKAPDLWQEATDEFRGARLSFRIGGGLFFFGGGDVGSGALGEFDRIAASLRSSGATFGHEVRSALHSGADIAADAIYGLSPRLGLGLRVDYLRSNHDSTLLFNFGGVNDYSLDTKPIVSGFAVRPGLYYEAPINGWLKLQAHGGPALYHMTYEFTRRFVMLGQEDDLSQKVSATGFGVQGGVGLEFRLDNRAGLFVEVQGRYARLTGLDGSESVYTWKNYQTETTLATGTLSFGEKDGYPVLSVGAAGAGFQKAALDLSGVSLAAGLRIRF